MSSINSKKKFGSREIKSIDTIYQAASDGFLLVRGESDSTLDFDCYVDSVNPPTAIVAKKRSSTTGAQPKLFVCLPIMAGEYWKVTSTTSTAMYIWWVENA